MAEDQFFAAPPAEEAPAAPPAGEDGGFTLLGDATDGAPPADDAAAPFVGDVQESGEDMGFAGGAPAEDAFASPPAEATDAPIVLAPPPEEAEIAVETSDDPEDLAGLVPVSSEPSAMQKWNEEWQVTLTARKDEENAKKAEMVEAARVALEEFKAGRETKRETKMAKNREDEQAKLEDIEADLENDNSWQRVSKMVDLTHDGAEAGEDTTRMRDMFILLKNEQGLASKVA
mmetsp:Transcript_54073/g.131257  ORF Transcript_54073/g.131257 Transcript_54073/m.131257 type:complete len:231 (-) Transcript_54073:272-964(-)